MQKHKNRSETWNLISGEASIKTIDWLGNETEDRLSMDSGLTIPRETWHQGVNKSSKPAHIVEVWRGKSGHCLLYTSPSPRDKRQSRMPSSA